MFDNKESNWQKSKDEEDKGPMKKAELYLIEMERQASKEKALNGGFEEDKKGALQKKKATDYETSVQEKIGEKAIKCFKNFVRMAKVEQET